MCASNVCSAYANYSPNRRYDCIYTSICVRVVHDIVRVLFGECVANLDGLNVRAVCSWCVVSVWCMFHLLHMSI